MRNIISQRPSWAFLKALNEMSNIKLLKFTSNTEMLRGENAALIKNRTKFCAIYGIFSLRYFLFLIFS